MAIFGNLTDIPLSDILTLGAKGLGRMSITHHETSRIYVLNFLEKDLISLLVDQTRLTDVFSVTSAFAFLMKIQDADFIIERQLREDCIQQFDFLLPVDQLVASVMAAIAEMESLRCHFPSEKTVFISPSRNEIWLGEELSQFYEQSYTLLARGASGEDLAAHTGMSLERVLLNLYKLRASGLITPSRAVQPTSKSILGEETRTRLCLFNKPLATHLPNVPCITFDDASSTDSEEPSGANSNIPGRGFHFPQSKASVVTLPPPLPSTVESEKTTSAVSADLRQVQIVHPDRGLAGILFGRLAKLCRI